MKKVISMVFLVMLLLPYQANSQGLLKKVANSMKDELLGTDKTGSAPKQSPEPPSACAQPLMVLELSGKLKLDYSEIAINTKEDGSLLVQDRISGNFYIVKGGVTTGPVTPGDPRVAGYENMHEADNNKEAILQRYKQFISKTGEKYTINFGGKTYGPYAEISHFTVTKSGDKFAALAVENLMATDAEGKKMEDAINNAKTDQERMELAMKYSQQMQQKMMAIGGPEGITPKLVTNISDATFNPLQGGTIQGKWKYDEILVSGYNTVLDMKGNTIINLKNEFAGADQLYINSTNTKYALFSYGTLTFSDNTTLSELFNPQLVRADGKNYLSYMYYSPKSNAIMECRIAY